MRCCDCKFRKDCLGATNDITAFEKCSLFEALEKRYEVVNSLGAINEPTTMTVCERNGLLGNCGLDCPAFDGRLCGG